MDTRKMRFIIALVFLSYTALLFLQGCTKEDKNVKTLPVLTTEMITDITSTTAISGGIISNDGGSAITARGICWNTLTNPAISDHTASDGSTGSGSFSCNISGLTGNSVYYVRAWATNSEGTAYGDQKMFTSSETSEFAVTMAVTGATSTSATLNGSVNANYLPTSVSFEYGNSTLYGNTIPAIPGQVTGNEFISVNAGLSGLTLNTTYHYRLKIINSSGTAFGDDMQFTAKYAIGESTVFGGIIFYLDASGEHGLACAPEDQGLAIWGCGGLLIGVTSADLLTGAANTEAIVTACTMENIAARKCYDLVLNGYSDWYLPSQDELNMMYTNLRVQGLGGFSDQGYWSSTEYDAFYAWSEYFSNGETSWYGGKESQIPNFSLVRAVRTF